MSGCIVNIAFTTDLATLPIKGSPGSAGYDLYSSENVTIPVGERRLVNTGIKMRFPDYMYGRIAPRSGLSVRHGIDVGAGVIDSDYRGEVKVLLINNGPEEVSFGCGTRIAQIIYENIAHPHMQPCSLSDFENLYATQRGQGGFGSTGAN